MKKLFLATFLVVTATLSAQDKKEQPKAQVVEAACGQCQFKMPGHACDLAIRVDGKTYFVEGTSIDSHGDAHADDGFCAKVRKAEVVGEIKNDRFIVSQFKLLPETKK